MLSIQETRPPYVEFKQVAVEDRNATIESGIRKTKNVDMAYIQQIGQRDSVEKNAEEWLEQLKKQCYEGRQPEVWYAHFKKKYDDWKAGRETPEVGTPVKEWPVLSPADVENMLAMKTFTVEDVSNWSEEAIAKFGVGGRVLRDKARAWLSSGNKTAEKLVALEVENKQLQDMINTLSEKIKALEEDKPKRGRPAKEEE